jgi:putative acetyltransferase
MTAPPEETPAVAVRPERAGDAADIRACVVRAFGRPAEADLVDALRVVGGVAASLVAVAGARVVGHVLFSPVTIEGAAPDLAPVGLAPVAVLPEVQRRGIGAALIEAGLARCRAAGHGCVVVLGHPAYYPRFGFAPASRFGLRSAYDVPDDTFMALELRTGALLGRGGTVRYRPEFAGV